MVIIDCIILNFKKVHLICKVGCRQVSPLWAEGEVEPMKKFPNVALGSRPYTAPSKSHGLLVSHICLV